MRRWALIVCVGPLVLFWLACGLSPVTCREAHPRRQRALDAYRALRQADLQRFEREYETSETARAYGAHSAAAMSIDSARGDLAHLDALEQAIAARDETATAQQVRELGYTSLNGNHPDALEELETAQRAAESCTP